MTVLPAARPARIATPRILSEAVLAGFVLAAYCALTALLFRQFLPHMSSALLGPPEDNLQDFWNSWYALQSHPDGLFFTRTIRFPEGVPLHYHSFAYPQLLAVRVLAALSGNGLTVLVLLQNLTLLASFPLAGLGAFYLCRHLTGSMAGSFAGGVVFAFNPSHVAQAMHHMHVAQIQFLPFFVLCYLIALERHSKTWLAGAVAFHALAALSSWYYLFYAVYFMAFHLLYLRIRDHAWPRGWNLAAPALCCLGTALLLSPLLLPMLGSGLEQGAYYPGRNTFVADLAAYFAFPSTHLLAWLGEGIYGRIASNIWEGTVYLGLVSLAVLTFAAWKARGAERRILFYALGGMAFFAVIASGDALHVAGWQTPLHMPAVILGKLPFLGNVRTPARAIVFVHLFLSVAVALGAAIALRARPTARVQAALSLAAMLLLADLFPARLQTTPVACPAQAYAPIINDPDRGFGVLDLPDGYAEQNYAMLMQACHGRPVALGVVSRQMRATLADRLETRDLGAQKRQLTAARIKYIVLRRRMDGLSRRRAPDGLAKDYRQTYPAAYDDGGMTVLRVY